MQLKVNFSYVRFKSFQSRTNQQTKILDTVPRHIASIMLLSFNNAEAPISGSKLDHSHWQFCDTFTTFDSIFPKSLIVEERERQSDIVEDRMQQKKRSIYLGFGSSPAPILPTRQGCVPSWYKGRDRHFYMVALHSSAEPLPLLHSDWLIRADTQQSEEHFPLKPVHVDPCIYAVTSLCITSVNSCIISHIPYQSTAVPLMIYNSYK